MKHKLYHEKIVQHHHVMLMGWPQNILFKNLGECSSSLQELQSLLEKLLNGQMYWKTITEDELNELEDEHKKQIEDGKITPPAPHRCHSNYGRKKKRKWDIPLEDDEDSDSSQELRKQKRTNRRDRTSPTVESENETQTT